MVTEGIKVNLCTFSTRTMRTLKRNIRDHPPRGILLQFMLIEPEKVYGEAKVGADSFIATKSISSVTRQLFSTTVSSNRTHKIILTSAGVIWHYINQNYPFREDQLRPYFINYSEYIIEESSWADTVQ